MLNNSNKEWLEATWRTVDNKLKRVAVKSREKIPYTTVDGVHNDMSQERPDFWTNGFWPGMMWLMYKETGNEEYKKTAQRAEELLREAFKEYEKLHHDVGFMFHISLGADYRITGDKNARNEALYAAATLASRYNVDGEYIRAWNGKTNAGLSIIDCMMNLPLLYWAADEIGDVRFKRVAMHHADMALRDHVRPDGSINHIVDHDLDSGEVIRVCEGQGISPDSCWTRGQAWAIYGLILSYIHTGKKDYLDAAIKTANYFIANVVPYNYMTPVDFRAPLEPAYYDSTAGVCAACGFLEIAKYVSEAESRMYVEAAVNILKATDEHFCDYSEGEDSLVGMGTLRYPVVEKREVHIPIIYGDFFYVEALLKLKGSDFLIW